MAEKSPLAFFKEEQENFARLLSRLVALQSHTGDGEAINRFQDEMEALFSVFGPQTKRIGCAAAGDLLRLTIAKEKRDFIVLLAHVDTVCLDGEGLQPRIDGDRLYGSGACDMKAGIATIFFVIQALARSGFPPGLRLEILLNPDEEAGSPDSSGHLLSICSGARAVLLPEPCGPAGAAKVRRKAIARIRARLQGKAAHSGVAPEEGRDANRALAKLIAAIDSMASAHPGMIFNPGVVGGGAATNVVAAESFLDGEIRSFANSDLERMLDEIASIASMDGVAVRWQNLIQHPALEMGPKNEELFQLAQKVMAEISYPLPACDSGGASDGSTLSSAGIPVLDGIGMKGGESHAPEEYVETGDFPFRAHLIYRLIEELA